MDPIPLPFYEVLEVLIKPTPLVTVYRRKEAASEEAYHKFYLSYFKRGAILRSRREIRSTDENGDPTTTIQSSIQVQLRFWTSQTLERQDDLLPAELLVYVNKEKIRRKGSSPQTFDITPSDLNFFAYMLAIKWVAKPQYNFLFTVHLVRKLTARELLSKLVTTKPMKPLCDTHKMIKKLTSLKSQNPDLICPKSLKISLTCPVGKSRMSYPCRGVNCKHLQCFDANSFLMMNEKKSTFLCPVCSVKIKLSELCLDEYFMDVIKKLSDKRGCNDVQVFADGTWFPVGGQSSTSQQSQNKSPSEKIIEVITIED